MKLGYPLIALSAFALIGCVDRAAQQQAKQTEEIVKDPTTAVEVMNVSSVTVADTLAITGTIETSDDVTVTALVGGAVIAVYVHDGDPVSVGQVIAKLDDESFRASVSQARAQANAAKSALDQAKADAEVGPLRSAAKVTASEARLSQAKSRLQKLLNGARPEEKSQAQAMVDKTKSDLATAKLSLERANRLYDEGAISKASLEQSQNSYNAAVSAHSSALEAQRLVDQASRKEDIDAAEQDVRAAEQQLAIDKADQRLDLLYKQRVESAESNWRAAQESLKLAEIALENTVIRSPFNGRLSGKPVQIGTYLPPGAPFARIVGVGGAYFEAEIPESQVKELKVGDPVTVTIDAVADTAVDGTLSTISLQATGAGRLFLARIDLEQIPSGLRAGMFARGEITIGERSGVHLLPSEAVVRDAGKTYVFLLSDDKAVRKQVEIGLSQNGSTEITGLSDGDTVIVKGQATLADGSPVKLEEKKEA